MHWINHENAKMTAAERYAEAETERELARCRGRKRPKRRIVALAKAILRRRRSNVHQLVLS